MIKMRKLTTRVNHSCYYDCHPSQKHNSRVHAAIQNK